MDVALDDLASLLAPEVLVICEGSQNSNRVHAWDERIYRHIFRDLHPQVEFKSSGGKGELDQAAAIAAVIAPGTRILKLRDRDALTDENRAALLADDPNLRVLGRYSLESYLLADEVLAALVSARGEREENALDQLKEARNGATCPDGSMKGALGAVFSVAKRVLENTEGLGENRTQFSAGVLAILIVPDMKIREELLDAAGLLDMMSLNPAAGASSRERPLA